MSVNTSDGNIGNGAESPERVVAWGAELRRVHQRLRESLELAFESVENQAAGLDPDAAPGTTRELLIYCWGFCVALSGHHRSEDAALFPQIVAEYPELAPVIEKLSQDHSMIEHLIQSLQRAIDEGAEPATTLRHLEGISAVMESHFGYEERQLIAVLDDAALGQTRLFGTRPTELFGPIA